MAAGSRWSLVLAAVIAALIAAPAARASGWSPCADGFGADCMRVSVPLDRSGELPGTVGLRVARIPAAAAGLDPRLPVRRPGSGGLDELEGILWSVSSLTTDLPRRHVRPARHRPVGAAALPGGRRRPRCAPPPPARRARTGSAPRAATTRRPIRWRTSRRSAGARRGADHPAGDLLRDRARARVRARASRPGRADGARLRGRPRRRGSVRASPGSGRWVRACARCARPAARA